MAQPILMPNVGISVESCILTEWNKKKGEVVKKDELLFTYETDKSTVEETAPCDGTILEQFFEEGDDIPVMTVIGVIGNPGENIDEFIPSKSGEEQPPETVNKDDTKPEQPETIHVNTEKAEDGFLKVSPRAKALASKAGVDARFATPTGAEGRIVEGDIQVLIDRGPSATYAASGSFQGAKGTGIGGKFSVADIDVAVPDAQPAETQPNYTDEKMSGVRRAIAKTMKLSLSSIPQLTHSLSFDATEILEFRKKIKNSAEGMGLNNITLNDIILFAVSRMLSKPEHRALNAHYLENDTVRYFNSVNLGVAVDTEKGLLVPTLFNADKKSLNEISVQAKELAAICQKGAATPDMLSNGTFTVSNLGVFGIESFTPVINPPQTGILGVDGITTRVKEVNGELKAYKAMGLSLTYNHSVVDGAPASRFLADLKNTLENFSVLLCK
ncbi:MAG: dihydrolipoamide acetyltransferase family protein [Oscillospiraceae bacterium]|nr:dihydrolipoamide acetyltransferase family protein [Oscillospiraceae bacterium]MDD4413348.1 dihydrolipoamide acetyltransferase family protein [Oscillospiraceae bacterium]